MGNAVRWDRAMIHTSRLKPRSSFRFLAIFERASPRTVSIFREGEANGRRGSVAWRGDQPRVPSARSGRFTPSGRWAVCPTPSCWSDSSPGMATTPRMRLRPWWIATGRRSWACVAGCCRARTIARTPSRRPSSSWRVGPRRSADGSNWRAGSMASRSGRRRKPGAVPRSNAQGKGG